MRALGVGGDTSTGSVRPGTPVSLPTRVAAVGRAAGACGTAPNNSAKAAGSGRWVTRAGLSRCAARRNDSRDGRRGLRIDVSTSFSHALVAAPSKPTATSAWRH